MSLSAEYNFGVCLSETHLEHSKFLFIFIAGNVSLQTVHVCTLISVNSWWNFVIFTRTLDWLSRARPLASILLVLSSVVLAFLFFSSILLWDSLPVLSSSDSFASFCFFRELMYASLSDLFFSDSSASLFCYVYLNVIVCQLYLLLTR